MTKPESERPSTRLAGILAREMREKKNGILLIDFPTGYGKSWAARRTIAELAKAARLEGRKRPRRVIYVTPTRVNLPSDEDLAKAFKEAGAEMPKPGQVLRLMSIVDMLDVTLRDDVTDLMPERFYSMDEFRKLEISLSRYRKVKRMSGGDLEDLKDLKEARDRELRLAEHAFRTAISRALKHPDGSILGDRKEKSLSRTDRVKRLRDDPDWQWLGKLYPTAFIDDADVIVCSVSKLINVTHTLVDPPFCLGESKYVEDAIVIMDEIDSAKAMMLKKFIGDAASSEVDLPSMTYRLATSLENRDLPRMLTHQAHPSEGKGLPDPDEMLRRCRKVAKDAMAKAHLGTSYKAADGLTKGNYVLYDYEHAILRPDAAVKFDRRERFNTIVDKGDSSDSADADTLSSRIGKMRGLVSFVQSYLWPLARNYEENRRLMSIDSADFTTDSAARSILDHFQLTQMESQYVLDGCRATYAATSKTANPRASGDRSVYAQGLRLVSLRDDDRHDMSTRIMSLALQRTSEAFLMRLAEHAFVLGLSATARVNSVLSNFDFDYIQYQRPGMLQTLSDGDFDQLREDFSKMNEGYAQVHIKPHDVCGNVNVSFDTICNWLPDVAETIHSVLNEIEDAYDKARYFRFAYAFHYFLSHEDIKAMLALTMPAPSTANDKSFQQAVLKRLFTIIAKSMGMADAVERHVRFVESSSTFQVEYEGDAKRELEKGTRIFLVASYQSLGTGVNLQFKDPDPASSVMVWQDDSDDRDFDAIYLDRPTHLAPYCHKMSTEASVGSIFELAELYEHDEIGKRTLEGFSSQLARCVYGDTSYGKSLADLPSVRAKGTRLVNQALGRITRTARKSPVIHVLYDAKIGTVIDPHAMDGQMVNEEYRKLVEKLSVLDDGDNQDMDRYLNHAQRINRQSWAAIEECTDKSHWTDDDMAWWQGLRAAVLAHPTWSNGDDDIPTEQLPLLRNASVLLPEPATSYTYKEQNDYGSVDVSFSETKLLRRHVSAQAARLDALAKVPLVQKLFQEHGWPLEWLAGENMLCPVVFNNIYLGALGEEVGRRILEEYLDGVRLEPITNGDWFEVADYRFAGTDIYVDFKYWSVSYGQDEHAEIEKLREKKQRLGATKLLVCNVLSSGGRDLRSRRFDDGSILTVPYLIREDTGAIDGAKVADIDEWMRG